MDTGILIKYNLSPNELFFIRIILLSIDEDRGYYDGYICMTEESRGNIIELLNSLQVKGVILKSYKIPNSEEDFEPFDVEFNKNFIKYFYKCSFDMGEELYNTYPMFGNINGSTVALRGVSKKYDSLEDFYRAYGKTINWNPDTHNKIIELVKWAKENTQFIQFSLATFLIDRKWNELEALRSGELVNVNYDTIKML